MTEPFTYEGYREDQKSECWTTYGVLDAWDQSVDLYIETTRPSFQYETRCFNAIRSNLKENEFAVGPHLVDFLFMNHGWEKMIRPDGFIFTAQPEYWVLSTIIEVKTGKYALNRKLRGFSTLLEAVRFQSAFLPSALQEIVGDIYEIPKEIYIPSQEKIHVLFAGPTDKKLESVGYEHQFRLVNMKI